MRPAGLVDAIDEGCQVPAGAKASDLFSRKLKGLRCRKQRGKVVAPQRDGLVRRNGRGPDAAATANRLKAMRRSFWKTRTRGAARVYSELLVEENRRL